SKKWKKGVREKVLRLHHSQRRVNSVVVSMLGSPPPYLFDDSAHDDERVTSLRGAEIQNGERLRVRR
ncbi:MAG TPA: hypothetical protein VMF69_12380, partial [Gemmataceae bacterium]|nr:hypothetical protein [Gemmataceae bacterium]